MTKKKSNYLEACILSHYICVCELSQGRINYGPKMNTDFKGILSNVTLNGHVLEGWKMSSLPLESFTGADFPQSDGNPVTPTETTSMRKVYSLEALV